MASTFFRRICIWIVLAAGICKGIHAQEYKYEIGGMAGSSFYMGDTNKNALFKGMNPAFGVVFRYNPNFRWALKSNLLWGAVSGTTEGLKNVFPEGKQGAFSRNFMDASVQMEFNFFPYSDKFAYENAKRISPYLFLGIGVTAAPAGEKSFFGANIPLGVGVKYKVKNRINIGGEFSFRKLFGDGLDTTDETNRFLDDPYRMKGSLLKNKDWYACLLLTVTWDFGPRNRPCNSKNSNSSYR